MNVFQLLSTLEVDLFGKMKRITYLCVILHVKHKKLQKKLRWRSSLSSRSLMVDGQDKLVQGRGRRGGGRDEVFENVWEVASPSPELVSSILRTICFRYCCFVLFCLL